MPGSRFDHLAQTLAMAGTRRGVLRLLVACFLAGGLALPWGEGASAGKQRRTRGQRVDEENHNSRGRRRKHPNRQRKDRRRDKRTAKHPTPDPSCTPACPPCQRCSGGVCTAVANGSSCGSGTICCTGTCCAGCCGADGACGACLVFVTSTIHTGNLQGSSVSGLAGADLICQQRADAADLPGTYQAWLSDATASPATRFRRSDLGYRLVNGTTVADSWADLTDGALDAPINVPETGGAVGSAHTWTHTQTNGSAGGTGVHCDNWTAAEPDGSQIGDIGFATESDADWTVTDAISCDTQNRLYCFQQR